MKNYNGGMDQVDEEGGGTATLTSFFSLFNITNFYFLTSKTTHLAFSK